MEKFDISRTQGRAVKFTGEKIATERADRRFNQTRGTDFTLYRTTGGKFVGVRENWTHWQGEHDTTDVVVMDTANEVFDLFGDCEQAQALYVEAGLDYSEEIE